MIPNYPAAFYFAICFALIFLTAFYRETEAENYLKATQGLVAGFGAVWALQIISTGYYVQTLPPRAELLIMTGWFAVAVIGFTYGTRLLWDCLESRI